MKLCYICISFIQLIQLDMQVHKTILSKFMKLVWVVSAFRSKQN